MMEENSPSSHTRSVVRWGVAVVLAGAALIGGFSLLAVFVWAAEDVPGWAMLVLGGGLAVGTAVFAWVVAAALRSRHD